MIAAALRSVGAARSIVIDENDEVLAGNGVVAAAAGAGISKVQVVEADGDTIIAVRRRGLTPDQKRDLAIFDNRAAELADWNIEQLAADVTAGHDLSKFFERAELKDLLRPAGGKIGLTDPDDAPTARATAIVSGDLFALGEHRLLCGDCTAETTVARFIGADRPVLMNTDPPYGVSYAKAVRGRTNQKKGGWADISGDDLSDDALLAFLTKAFTAVPVPVAFIWHPSNRVGVFVRAIEAADFVPSQQIIWVKNALVFGHADYQWRHEPCIYAKRKGARRVLDRTQTTVWEVNKTVGAEHPTQKPVALFLPPILNHTVEGESIYEPFAGSGSQFIAAEQTDRRCLGLEIEPSYCQVIIDRWEAFTGRKAEKVGEAARA